jgi:hypothetical protein
VPFVLILAGVVLLIAAVRGPSCGAVPCHQALFYLLAKDFTGPNNFIFWFVSILIIGAIGYIPKMKPISDGFLILVIVSLFVRKGAQGQSFIVMFENQIAGTQGARPMVTEGSYGGAIISPTQSYFIGGGGSPTVSVGFPSGGGVSVGGGGVTIGGGGGYSPYDPFGPFGGGDPFARDPGYYDPYYEDLRVRRAF